MYRVSQKKYTRLTSHYTTSIASILERLRNENEDKTKTHDWIDLGYFGAKS